VPGAYPRKEPATQPARGWRRKHVGTHLVMRPSDSVRIGLVGAGGVGDRHARVLSGIRGVTVAGVADPDPRRATRLAARHDAVAVADSRALVEAVRPDALYVCVPPFAHGEPEMVAVEHHLPLFVEKPLAADLATAKRLGAAIADARLVTATGYHWRYLDTVQHVRNLLDGRSPGLIVARWLDKVPPPAWWPSTTGSGGQVVEQATHLIDLIRYVAGEVRSVAADGARHGHCPAPANIDESSVALLRLAGGAIGTLAATCLAPGKHAAVVEIAASGLAVTISEDELVVHDHDGVHHVHPRVNARTAVDEDFIGLVRGGRSTMAVTYSDAIRTHRVACAIATSARERRAVDL
jgi:myo-inositol 2-dehydrogenase / D-chiro-inositol 1-dehydrogenase